MIKEFISKYKAAAELAAIPEGFDPIIILTAAAHESAFGRYAFGNNFFGTKPGKNWTGKTQLLRTTEYSINPNLKFPEILSRIQKEVRGKLLWEYKVRDYFRAYDTPEEGFKDYINFIKSFKRYSKALEAKNDPIKYFSEIGKAGYATDSAYTVKLLNVYNQIKSQTNEANKQNEGNN